MTSARDDARGPDEGPGGRLRQERLERGLSNQQAAEQLNLDGVVIQAIEDNDFPALGAPVFARGHLRRYAALLGIPEGEVLAAYDRSRQPETPTLVPRAHLERLPERHAPRWPWVLGGLAVLLVVCGLIAFLGSGAWQWPWHKSEPRPGEIGGQQSGPDISPGTTTTSAARPFRLSSYEMPPSSWFPWDRLFSLASLQLMPFPKTSNRPSGLCPFSSFLASPELFLAAISAGIHP